MSPWCRCVICTKISQGPRHCDADVSYVQRYHRGHESVMPMCHMYNDVTGAVSLWCRCVICTTMSQGTWVCDADVSYVQRCHRGHKSAMAMCTHYTIQESYYFCWYLGLWIQGNTSYQCWNWFLANKTLLWWHSAWIPRCSPLSQLCSVRQRSLYLCWI